MDKTAERHERFWTMLASPVVWSLHFLACYITAAIWCGRVASVVEPVPALRVVIGVYTVIALAVIGAIGWWGLRAHRQTGSSLPNDDDTPEGRHGFVGFATLLLSALSAVAVIYAALVAVVFETCQ